MNGKVKGKKVVKKQDLNDLQIIINEAFSCIAAVKASGDAVDMIAAARANLRKAFELAGKATFPQKVDETEAAESKNEA